MEGLETIADCDALLKKVKRRREELVQASKLAKIQQLKTVSDKWDKELDTYNQNAYPIADSHTFTIDGKRWFVDQLKPGKSLRIGFCMMGRSYSWNVHAKPHGWCGTEEPRGDDWERVFEFGRFLAQNWPQ